MGALLFPAVIFLGGVLLIGLYLLADWHSKQPFRETARSFAVVLAVIAGLAWLLYPAIQ
jgi:hypothetical protein